MVGLCVLWQHEEVHMLFLCQHKAVDIPQGEVSAVSLAWKRKRTHTL